MSGFGEGEYFDIGTYVDASLADTGEWARGFGQAYLEEKVVRDEERVVDLGTGGEMYVDGVDAGPDTSEPIID